MVKSMSSSTQSRARQSVVPRKRAQKAAKSSVFDEVTSKITVEQMEQIKELKQKFSLVGRNDELRNALAAKKANKHLIFEGDVGTGKTRLATAIAAYHSQTVERVDGDDRFTAAKLIGYFDPPVVIKEGYSWDSFISGPLVTAMKEGSILLLNELNRMPEGTQNVLLTAMDERKIQLPKLGQLRADDGFFVIAAMNPAEFVATTPLSEALRDRFVWIKLDHQSIDEEILIVKQESKVEDRIAKISVLIVRATRNWKDLRRGSSIRGAIDMASLIKHMDAENPNDWLKVAIMSLATKIEVEDGIEKTVQEVIEEVLQEVLSNENFF